MSQTLPTRSLSKFHASFVDESLFGARKITNEPEESFKDFDPPWITEKESKIKRNKPLLFYCPSIATSSKQKTLTTANGMEEIAAPSPKSRPSSARKNKQRMKFRPSYVDESLFKSVKTNDEKPINFDPPWDKADKKPRPILWDYSGGRTTTYLSQGNREECRGRHSMESARSESHRSGRSNRMGQDNRRPWR